MYTYKSYNSPQNIDLYRTIYYYDTGHSPKNKETS